MSKISDAFCGVWIPREVILNPDLTPTAKVLYSIIMALDAKGCTASNDYFSKIVGCSERHIQNLMQELEQHNLIIRKQLTEYERVITTVSTAALAAEGGRTTVRGGDEPQFVGGTKPTSSNRKENKKENRDTKGPDFMLTTQPAHMAVPEFSAAWHRWIQYAFPKKKVPYLTYVGQLEFLNAMTPADAVECIEQSIRNGWRGLFPVRKSMKQTKPLTKNDHEQF